MSKVYHVYECYFSDHYSGSKILRAVCTYGKIALQIKEELLGEYYRSLKEHLWNRIKYGHRAERYINIHYLIPNLCCMEWSAEWDNMIKAGTAHITTDIYPLCFEVLNIPPFYATHTAIIKEHMLCMHYLRQELVNIFDNDEELDHNEVKRFIIKEYNANVILEDDYEDYDWNEEGIIPE